AAPRLGLRSLQQQGQSLPLFKQTLVQMSTGRGGLGAVAAEPAKRHADHAPWRSERAATALSALWPPPPGAGVRARSARVAGFSQTPTSAPHRRTPAGESSCAARPAPPRTPSTLRPTAVGATSGTSLLNSALM